MGMKYLALSEETQRKVNAKRDEIWTKAMSSSQVAEYMEMGYVVLGTIVGAVECFDFLPSEERAKIFTLADWALRMGFAMGQCPQEMLETVRAVRSELTEVERPEWFEHVLDEYRGKGDAPDAN